MDESCRAAEWPQSVVSLPQEGGKVLRFRRRVDAARLHSAPWPRAPEPRVSREEARVDRANESSSNPQNERARFIERLNAAIKAAELSGERLAVVVAQVAVQRGDRPAPSGPVPWQALSERIVGRLRRTDAMARLRANEFALLLKDADTADRAAAAVQSLCETPFEDGHGAQWRLSVALGASAYPADADEGTALLRRASEAAGRSGLRAVVGEPARSRNGATPVRALKVAEPSRSPARSNLERMLGLAGMQRRVVRAGEIIYRAGDTFRDVHVLHVGLCKLMMLTNHGHEELGSLLFKGDWLGVDGLDLGRHRYTALAIDTGELWSVRYDLLMQVATYEPDVMKTMHRAMVHQSSRDRDAVLMQHVLPADGKVADFLSRWAANLERSGLRSDQLVLPVTRAEIGAHLGLRLESVSRAISRLEREGLISFGPRNRREIQIPRLDALRDFVSRIEREA